MFRFISELWRRYVNHGVSERAAQLTYFLILAFFPFLIMLLQLLRYTPLSQASVLSQLLITLPPSTRDFLTSIVKDVIATSDNTMLVLSILGALWSASNGMKSLIQAINRSHQVDETRPKWVLKLMAIVMTIGLLLLVVATAGSNAFFDHLFSVTHVKYPRILLILISAIKYISAICVTSFVLAFLYRYAPNKKHKERPTWKSSWIGSACVMSGILITSYGFSYYVAYYSNYSRVYGSISGIIVLLIWLYMSSSLVILGAEIQQMVSTSKRENEAIN